MMNNVNKFLLSHHEWAEMTSDELAELASFFLSLCGKKAVKELEEREEKLKNDEPPTIVEFVQE